jgi:hypothetical protein
MTYSDETGIDSPHCGCFNRHAECGTYEVLLPICICCGECTEVEANES